MNAHHFTLCGTTCIARPSGALVLPDHSLLCVSDLHLGKSARIARRSGVMLPPYEVQATLEKLSDEIDAVSPKTVICLGDSFDDLAASEELAESDHAWITQLQAGRRWIWIEGNHDPGPVSLGGDHLAQTVIGGLTFRHIATHEPAEVSGHYHPKHRLAGRSRPAFVYDENRLIMPAFGAYTGGLSTHHAALREHFGTKAFAVLTGRKALPVPL